jgi:hypothetical protein
VVVDCRAKWAERVGVTERGSRRAFDPMCSGDGQGRGETGGLAAWRMGPRPRSRGGARRGGCWEGRGATEGVEGVGLAWCWNLVWGSQVVGCRAWYAPLPDVNVHLFYTHEREAVLE